MGEIAEQIINGEICQECLLPLEEAAHHPVICDECKEMDELFNKAKGENK